MSFRRASFLIAAAAALAPVAAEAFQLSGWVGGSGTQYDSIAPAADPAYQLHLDLGLAAAGYLSAPGDLDWRGNVAYGRNRQSVTGSRDEYNTLTYSAEAALFETRDSRATFRVGASRSQTDAATSGAGSQLTGTSLGTAYVASMRTNGSGIPALQLAGSWATSESTGLGREVVDRTTKMLDASVIHGTGDVEYRLNYRGMFEEGSLGALDYGSHTLSLGANAALSPSTDAGITGMYFVREPGSAAGVNPRFEDTSMSAFSTTSFGKSRVTSYYNYAHLLSNSAATGLQERLTHGVVVNGETTFSPRWSAITGAAVSLTQLRIGETETSAAGQRVNAIGRWNRPVTSGAILVETGGRVGLIEKEAGGTDLAWGATGSARYSRNRVGRQWSAAYRIDYDENIDALQGWALSQAVSADASAPLTRELVGNVTLALDVRRGHAVLLGDSVTRRGNLVASLRWPRHQLGVQGSVVDGIAGSLANPVRGDGLFLPVAFQTHALIAGAFARATLSTRFILNATVRYASGSGPDIPVQREIVSYLRLDYSVGRFVLAAEERYTVAGTTSFDLKRNEVMVTLTRHFSL